MRISRQFTFILTDEKWCVFFRPGEKIGFLLNPSPSKTLPTHGWQYVQKIWNAFFYCQALAPNPLGPSPTQSNPIQNPI